MTAGTVRGFSGPAAACWWLRRLKAVRKVGEVTQRLREEGVLAKAHRPKRSVTSGDSFEEVSSVMTLSDLGINRNIAAAGSTATVSARPLAPPDTLKAQAPEELHDDDS